MGKVNNKDWSILSTYRNEMFGLSIIGIMILHYFQNLVHADVQGLGKIFTNAYYNVVGSTGVEIFLFLSGMGLCFSLNKNPNVLGFYGRRLKRILLAYVLWGGAFWYIRDVVILKLGYDRFLYDFSFMSFWDAGVSSLWFIAFIIPMYLLYPLIHVCFKKENKYRTLIFIEMLIVCVLTIDWMKVHTPNFYEDVKLAIYRIPIFLFGAYYANKVYEKKAFSIGDNLLVITGLVANLLCVLNKTYMTIPFIKYIDVEYIKCLYSISLIVAMARFLSYFKKGFLNKFLIATGALSLELYMTHVNIRNIMTVMGFKLNELWLYVTCVLISIVCSIILSNACKGITYAFELLTTARKIKKKQLVSTEQVYENNSINGKKIIVIE